MSAGSKMARAVGKRFAIVEIRRPNNPPTQDNPSGRNREAKDKLRFVMSHEGTQRKAECLETFEVKGKTRESVVELYSVPIKCYPSFSHLREAFSKRRMTVYYGRVMFGAETHVQGHVRPIAVGSGAELQAKHRAGAIRRKRYTELERSGAFAQADFLAYVYGSGAKGPDGKPGPHYLQSAPAREAIISSLDEMAVATTGMSIDPNWVENATYWLKKLEAWNGLIPAHLRHAEKRVEECNDADDFEGMAYWQGVVRRIGSAEAARHFDADRREYTSAFANDTETGLPAGGFIGRQAREAHKQKVCIGGKPVDLAKADNPPACDVPKEPETFQRKGLPVIVPSGLTAAHWYPGKALPMVDCECRSQGIAPDAWITK